MAVDANIVELRFDNVTAGLPVSCAIKTYDATTINLYYGVTRVEATPGADFTVDLADNFETFDLTPTTALLAKITALIAANPATESNVIWVRRELGYVSDFEESDAFLRLRIAQEFDRTLMRIQQLANNPLYIGEASASEIAAATASGVFVSPRRAKLAVETHQRQVATNLEAADGTSDVKDITPLRLAYAFRENGVISARSFGMKGDGSVETSKLQDAIDFIHVNGGGELTIPATTGEYVIDDTVEILGTVPLRIRGLGQPLIRHTATGNKHLFDVGVNTQLRQSFIEFESLRLWGVAGANGSAIRGRWLANLHMRRLNTWLFGGPHFHLDNCYAFQWLESQMNGHNAAGTGFLGSSGIYGYGASGNACRIQGKAIGFGNVSGAGVYFEKISGDIGPHYGMDIWLDAEFNYWGVRLSDVWGAHISGYFEQNSQTDIYIPPASNCKGIVVGGRGSTMFGLVDLNGIDGLGFQQAVYTKASGTALNVGTCTKVDWSNAPSRPNGGVVITDKPFSSEEFEGWTTYTTTWSALTGAFGVGDGSTAVRYYRRGRNVRVRFVITIGATALGASSGWKFTLPFPARAIPAGQRWLGKAGYDDVSASSFNQCRLDVTVYQSGTEALISNNTDSSNVGNTSPITWAVGDNLFGIIDYEAA